jgi:antitoxin component of MazEF toxin-antitoxin module
MQTTIRKFGNSKGAIIPASLLKELNLDVNDKVDAKAEGGRIVIEAIAKPKPEYSLSELLGQCDENSMTLNDEDKKWLNSPAVGREEI